MSSIDCPCLSIAIARLVGCPPPEVSGQYHTPDGNHSAHFAIWVIRASYPGGYVHHDRVWPYTLSLTWEGWQDLFQIPSQPPYSLSIPAVESKLPEMETLPFSPEEKGSYSSRLMQQLGMGLWQWVFDGPIQSCLSHSQGIALGKNQPLRVRLDIRDPDLIPLPWEIMQSQAGKQAISVSPTLLFSRTTSDVDPLPPQRTDQELNILLVFGATVEAGAMGSQGLDGTAGDLQLEAEAETLAKILVNCSHPDQTLPSLMAASVPCHVDRLIQPTAAELMAALEMKTYNIVFYGGHGVPSPDGGRLYLQPETTLSGTEFANVLVRGQVTLAVLNTCWSAKGDTQADRPTDAQSYRSLPRSSFAEVLLHHGIPAVLGMREAIADREALSFIEAFAEALAKRLPIDEATAIARQRLITLYKYNQPAWTLPVLYMHPNFNGQLLVPAPEGITELPDTAVNLHQQTRTIASLRSVEETTQVWQIHGGLMRVGRREENDIVISERWVSQRHAEIIRREPLEGKPTYWLRDFSRFGTLVLRSGNWQKIHQQEIPLKSGEKIKFGSSQGQMLEFVIEESMVKYPHST
ncbi:CHAT domain-containing protein [Roseofilum sp. BLCC_M91]|uniref:CHAT domain-containing protein n=1 Tax=Roseofilum halophilum BLCC-M91 TaxID=3022259 RepID=A0ABT7BQZ8_9CYAN|nr:CHAT domain-containing protein [Roseofilum halophilum]MDJ1180713.1 CHAT domain-containing protein [Roseofilum halophilum BLCC-M91]